MRVGSSAQVMMCISIACFVASFIVQGFSPEHPLVLTFTRMSVLSVALGMMLGTLSILAHRLSKPRAPAMAQNRR